jgi:hypothetical protein
VSRVFSTFANARAKSLLERLLSRVDPNEYRIAMTNLGRELGERIAARLPPNANLYVVCTAEDADFLTTGLLEILEQSAAARVSVACFWNGRSRFERGGEIAPVIKSYVEPQMQCDALIVTKSIIATSCVVRTNILDILARIRAPRILIAAPVMFKGARKALRKEFSTSISELFEFYYFATDSELNEESREVFPGIGGMVYQRLGLEVEDRTVRYVPELVRARRRLLYR